MRMLGARMKKISRDPLNLETVGRHDAWKVGQRRTYLIVVQQERMFITVFLALLRQVLPAGST